MNLYIKKYDNPNYYNMLGTSMQPTLRAGEGLFIDSEIDRENLQIGDIIIYQSSKNSDKNIVHRIIKICKDGYITRGDNNRDADDYIVEFENIIGKAVSVRRGDKTVFLTQGYRGHVLHQKLKIRKFCLIYFLKIPSLISKGIDKSRILNVFHRFVKFDIVTIKKGNFTDKLILHNNKRIGRKCRLTGKWIIRFPYKYFIDREKLS